MTGVKPPQRAVSRIKGARLCGEVEPAVEGLRKALTADPGNLEARLGLARVSLRGGRLAEVDAILAEVVAVEARLGRGPRED